MPKLILTPKDHLDAHRPGIALEDPPPGKSPLEIAYDSLLKSYERLEAECAKAHRDAKAANAARDQARWQRIALFGLVVASFLGWSLTLWAARAGWIR